MLGLAMPWLSHWNAIGMMQSDTLDVLAFFWMSLHVPGVVTSPPVWDQEKNAYAECTRIPHAA